jgi:O-antigen/teichoic acid export membrane protein
MKVSIPSLIIGSVVGISLALNNYGVWSLVYSAIIQSLAGTIQIWYWTKWKPKLVFNWGKFNYHFHYGVKLMFSSILDSIFKNAYSIVIGKFFAPAQVGFFSRADSLKMLPAGTISSIITKVSFPLFASIQNDDERLKSIFKRMMQMVIFLVAPTLVLMGVLAEPLFRLLFTEKWLPAVPYFRILCINGVLYPIHGYNLQILNVKGRSDLFLKLEIYKKILVAIVMVISFPFGIYGLLYGSVTASLFGFFINAYYSGKFLNYTAWQQTKDLLPIILLSLLIGIFIYYFDGLLLSLLANDFIRLLAGSLLGMILFTIVAFLSKMESLFELITIIKRK